MSFEIEENERINICEESISQIQSNIDDIVDKYNLFEFIKDENDQRRGFFKPDDLREFGGLMNLEALDEERQQVIHGKIEGFDIEYENWKREAELQPDNSPQKEIYKAFSEIAKLRADKMRLENNIKPESEVLEILNENAEDSDLGRLERFKKWAKENLLGLSAVAISVAGILIIIIGARNALKSGAKAVGNLGKAIANIGKNFGALISSLLNLIGSILAWSAKGITFLAKKLVDFNTCFNLFFIQRIQRKKKKHI